MSHHVKMAEAPALRRIARAARDVYAAWHLVGEANDRQRLALIDALDALGGTAALVEPRGYSVVEGVVVDPDLESAAWYVQVVTGARAASLRSLIEEAGACDGDRVRVTVEVIERQ